MIKIDDLFVAENLKERFLKYSGPLFIAILIYSIVKTKKLYVSLTNDQDLMYYKRFSEVLRVGACCFGIAIAAIWTNNLEYWGDSAFWIFTTCFALGGGLIYYALIYVVDEKKFSNLPSHVQYIIKPNLKEAAYWMFFALGLGLLFCLYKLCVYIIDYN